MIFEVSLAEHHRCQRLLLLLCLYQLRGACITQTLPTHRCSGQCYTGDLIQTAGMLLGGRLSNDDPVAVTVARALR